MDDPAVVLQDLVQQQQQQQQAEQQGETIAAVLQFHNQKQQEPTQSNEHQSLAQENHEQQGFPQSESGQEAIHLDLNMAKSAEVTHESSGDKSGEQLLLGHATGQLLKHSGHLVGDSSSSPNTEILNDNGNPNLTNDSGASINNGGNTSGQFISSTSFIFKGKKPMTSLETINSVIAAAAASSSMNGSSSTTSPISVPAPVTTTLERANHTSNGNSAPSQTSDTDFDQRYDDCPTILKIPTHDWEDWLAKERVHCRWNMTRHRHRDKQTFARGPSACEWIREFQCDHAGRYRDRKDPNVDPSKKRKRSRSIKCNCPAFIKMKKQFQEDDVVVEYFWRHEGHVPDALEDIKAQRIPQDLKAWIKRRALEGHDWRAVKLLMTGGSPLLDELNPATKDNIRALLNASYSQFANTARQIKNKRESRSPSSQRSTQQMANDEEMPLAQSDSQSSSPNSNQRGLPGQDPKDDISAQTAWQLVSLNLSGDSLQSNHSNRDSQTLAIHNLSQSSSSEGQSSRDVLKRSTLTFDESLLNAEAISRVIREQVGVHETANSQSILDSQDIAPLPLVGTSATGSSATGPSNDQNGQNTAYSNNISKNADPKTSNQEGVTENTLENSSVVNEQLQQQQQQPQLTQQPRDMMLQMLRAIAELHKQMELTEEYGTQEDAIEIIESFALPVRLMKEALERRSSSR